MGTGPFMVFGVGLAFDPVNRIVFAPQSGGFGEVDAVTQVRRIVADQNVGLSDRVSGPVALVIEQTSGTPSSLLYVQASFGMLYRLDLFNSNRHLVSWAGLRGLGPLDSVCRGHGARSPARRRMAARCWCSSAAPTPRLVSVDLVTGTRTLVADIDVGDTDNAPQRMALDVANNRVLFVNNESLSTDVDQLYALDLGNGNVTTISDASKTGPMFTVPSNMILEPATNPTRAIIADMYSAQILAIDLATGNRSTFDNPGGGSGLTYTRTGAMILDVANSSILVNHIDYPSNLFKRPLAGGTRELITGANPVGLAVRGTGPPLYYVTSMDVDFAAQVAYLASSNNGSIIAVDLVSGDRVVLAH